MHDLHPATLTARVDDRRARVSRHVLRQRTDDVARHERGIVQGPPARVGVGAIAALERIPVLPRLEGRRLLCARCSANSAFGRVLVGRFEEDDVVRLLVSVPVDVEHQERPLLAVVVAVAGPVVERDQ